MTVTLYNVKSASNVLHRKYDTVQTNITATARGAVDVDRPTLLLDYSSMNFNYFYIAEFGRYYNVSSRALLPGEHILLSGESDPLESFSAAVYALDNVLAVRNEDINKWDKDIPDPYMITKAKRECHGHKFGSMQNVHSNSDATYIIGVI